MLEGIEPLPKGHEWIEAYFAWRDSDPLNGLRECADIANASVGQPGRLPHITSRHPVRHHERRAVVPGQQLVRLGIADERLGRGVEGELAAEPVIQAIERHARCP